MSRRKMGSRPVVFISYSHDSETHSKAVLKLALKLNLRKVEVLFDQFEQPQEGTWADWILEQIEEADKVLIVCSQDYRRLFERRDRASPRRGVAFEGSIITHEIYDAGTRTDKYRPVFLGEARQEWIPKVLAGRPHHALTSDAAFDALVEEIEGDADRQGFPEPWSSPQPLPKSRPAFIDESAGSPSGGSHRNLDPYTSNFSKEIQIIHMSDLPFGKRPLRWIDQLRQQAQLRTDGRGGFDYVVVAGTAARGAGGAAKRGGSGTFEENRRAWRRENAAIVRELAELLPNRADYRDRIVLLPGIGGPQGSPWSAEILPLEDLTFVVLDCQAKRESSLTSLLRELQRAFTAVEAVDYHSNTPTLLVTARPLILDGRGRPELVKQIREILDRLRVTFNLYGRGPVTCLGPDPFGCPHFALGTGLSRRSSQLRANALSIRTTFSADSGSHRNEHSVSIQALKWLQGPIEEFQGPEPFLAGELDAFFQKGIEVTPAMPIFRDELDRIRSRIAEGQRAFRLRGLPGVGKHWFWRELENPGLEGCRMVRVKLDGSDADSGNVKNADLRVSKALAEDDDSPIVITVFDVAMRSGGNNPGSDLHRKLFDWFNGFWNERVVILYLTRRVEDFESKVSSSNIKWETLEILPATDRIAERLRQRFSRVTPLEKDYLKQQTGNFVGLYSAVVRLSAGVFRRQLDRGGNGRVNRHTARAVIDKAIESPDIRDLGEDFLNGLGESNKERALVLEWLHTLAASEGRRYLLSDRMHRFRLADFFGLAERLDASLDRRKLEHRARSVVRRLTNSGLLEYDAITGEYFFAKTPPLIPFRVGSKVRPSRIRSVIFVFPSSCDEIAAELELLTAERAFLSGARFEFRFERHQSWDESDWDDLAGAMADGLVLVNDRTPSEKAVAALQGFERGSERKPRPTLVSISVGGEDPWGLKTAHRCSLPSVDDAAAKDEAADRIVAALGLSQPTQTVEALH